MLLLDFLPWAKNEDEGDDWGDGWVTSIFVLGSDATLGLLTGKARYFISRTEFIPFIGNPRNGMNSVLQSRTSVIVSMHCELNLPRLGETQLSQCLGQFRPVRIPWRARLRNPRPDTLPRVTHIRSGQAERLDLRAATLNNRPDCDDRANLNLRLDPRCRPGKQLVLR